MARISRRLKTAIFVEAVAVPVVLLYLTPHWPRTVLGWALVILFGPPLWFLAEGLSEWVGGVIPVDTVTAVAYGIVFLMLLIGGYIVFSMLLGIIYARISIEAAPNNGMHPTPLQRASHAR